MQIVEDLRLSYNLDFPEAVRMHIGSPSRIFDFFLDPEGMMIWDFVGFLCRHLLSFTWEWAPSCRETESGLN